MKSAIRFAKKRFIPLKIKSAENFNVEFLQKFACSIEEREFTLPLEIASA